MLDDDQRVTGIAQVAQAFEQTGRVARMKARGWLVEDKASTDKPRTQDGGQSNPLMLTAR